MTTIYIILERCSGHHKYITCFFNKIKAEEYIFEHPKCYIRHEVGE